MSEPFIGIDLGTTNSCIAHCKDGKAEIIPDFEGKRLIPSMVYYDRDNGKVIVGKRAYPRSLDNAQNFISGFKRYLGKTYETIKRSFQSSFNWNDIQENHDEMAVFGIEINDKLYLKKPEDVSSEVLKHLKLMAKAYLGTEIKEAVVSVPAYFNNAQRQATKRAAEMAGLKVLRLITEPTAAALHYVEKLTDGKILVFDWGGGTLDVSLIEIISNNLKVVAVDGDTTLGGKDIDDLLYKHFCQTTKNIECIERARKLMEECISLKKELSVSEDSVIRGDLPLKMTRQQFEELCRNIFDRALDIVRRALRFAGWKNEMVDKVVLVGGSSRIPKVREMLGNTFGSSKIKTDLNPDEAVALGASIQAAQIKNGPLLMKKYTIEEVTPISLGLRTDVDMMLVFIERNTPLPARQVRSATTSKSNQKIAKFEIYEGERKNTKLNNKLGEFDISGLPRRRAGDVEFNIEFSLDLDGILTVAASEESSGRSEALTINMTEFKWTENRKLHSVDEEKQLLREDEQFEEFAKLLKSYKLKWQQLMYDFDKSVEIRKRIQKAYILFTDSIKDLHFTEKEQLAKIHEELMHDIMKLFVMH